MTATDYESFKIRQKQLISLLDNSLPLFEGLNMRGWQDTIHKLRTRVASDRFKVMIIGQFKSGKSTLINAFLGEEVLPAFATPTTAVINEVKWGEKKRALLYFKNPLPKDIPPSIPQEALRHINQYKTRKEIPPLEIPIEQLESYVAIPDPTKDQAQSIAETPYSWVEIYWPLQLCQNGVEIIDSPGLNEHETRTKVTVDYLNTIDAIVFVMSCHALASLYEMEVIERDIRGSGHEDIFFICNRFDQIRENERERVRQFGQFKLAEKTNLSKEGKGIYFVSAADALDGKLRHDQQLLDKSGILVVEQHLAHFLVHYKGKVKLLQPARELTNALKKAMQENIPAQHRMLNEDSAVLEKRYNEVKPRLDDAEHKRDKILSRLDAQRERFKNEVRRATSSHLRELSQKIPEWSEAFKPDNKFRFLGGWTTTQIEALTKEVSEHLQGQIEKEKSRWHEQEFAPLLRDKLEEIREKLEDSLGEFITELEQIRVDVTGVAPTKINEGGASGIERILSAAGGLLIDPGAAVMGGTFGFKAMLKSIPLQIGVIIGLVLLHVTNPWLIIGTLAATGSIQALLKSASITEAVKKRIADEMVKAIRNKDAEIADKVVQELDNKLGELAQTVKEGMDKEIKDIRDQVDGVLEEKRKGQVATDARKAEIDKIGKNMAEIDNILTDFIFALAKS